MEKAYFINPKIILSDMTIANEAAYLYVLSKELTEVNSGLKKHSKKAEKHAQKHMKASSESKQQKHLKIHLQAQEKIHVLLQEHNRILGKLRHHQTAFGYMLRKEHNKLKN